MTATAETRSITPAEAEIRVEPSGDSKPTIRGIALRYDSLSLPMRDEAGREFREKFSPGAFSRALATGADVRFLVGHDPNLILGRNKAGTLRLIDDPDALRFEVDPPDTTLAQHYLEAIRRGDLSGVSFRFYKIADRWSGARTAIVRDVTEADLDDVSIVTYPAYVDTEVAMRSLDEYRRERSRRDPWLLGAAMRLRLAEASLTPKMKGP